MYKKLLRRLAALCCALALLATPAAALSVEEALGLLEENYVDPLPPEAYQAETLDELFLAVGDPYTYYMNAEELAQFYGEVEGEDSVTGIGASIAYTEEGILIVSVLPGGDAAEQGIQAGDVIVAVEGQSCVPGGEAHRAALIGEAGTYVNITVRHEGGELEDYRLERRYVVIHNTNVSLWEGGIGYIDCDSFGTGTGRYFYDGIVEYDDDAHLWVADVRANSGGVTTSAVYSTGLFTGAGTLLYLRDRTGYYRRSGHFAEYLTEDPVIVLTDAYTASAAEVFAADIRDCSAGIVVGGRTFGKGLAQLIFQDPDLFDGDAMKVTVYRFYSHRGNTNDVIGVIPTLLVDSSLAPEVAKLLGEREPDRPDGYLRLTLNGWGYCLDLEKARLPENRAAYDALLSALPPDVELELGEGDGWTPITAAQLHALDGAGGGSRWFTDVADSPYADAINTLGAYGILSGDGDGAFNPGGTLTRAQLCALMAQALGVTYTGESRFTDVEDGRWYAGPVNAMAELGFVEGEDGAFRPGDTLTQEEFITFMGRLAAFLNCRAYEHLQLQQADELDADETLSAYADWARPAADLMVRAAVEDDGSAIPMLHRDLADIDPQAPVLREEAAATLNAMLQALRIISY